MLHGLRERAHNVHRAVQKVANTAAAAGIAAGVAASSTNERTTATVGATSGSASAVTIAAATGGATGGSASLVPREWAFGYKGTQLYSLCAGKAGTWALKDLFNLAGWSNRSFGGPLKKCHKNAVCTF